ncbi:MAG: ribosomal RNA small subunit methyltransferase A [Clostridia bacterium]|nr:ribosomal RNA small subunit methyltransferase A [Clostridia bacterium]
MKLNLHSTDLSLSLKARVALEKHVFRFTHSLGQNFILDENVISDIVYKAGVQQGDNILEIGPGAGMMTAMMADKGAKVLAIELDRALEPVLNDVIGERDVKIVFQDALKADLNALTRGTFGENAPYSIVANLPYYITADFLMRAITLNPAPGSITLMVQKEAAERVMSQPGDKNWSALSASVRYFAEPEVVMEAPALLFTPPPHVDSCLLKLHMRKDRPLDEADEKRLMALIQAAFRMRRKTLANNLSASYSLSREETIHVLEKAGLGEKVRGEILTVDQLIDVMKAMQEKSE